MIFYEILGLRYYSKGRLFHILEKNAYQDVFRTYRDILQTLEQNPDIAEWCFEWLVLYEPILYVKNLTHIPTRIILENFKVAETHYQPLLAYELRLRLDRDHFSMMVGNPIKEAHEFPKEWDRVYPTHFTSLCLLLGFSKRQYKSLLSSLQHCATIKEDCL